MVAGEARLWLARVQYLGCVHHDFFRTLVYCVPAVVEALLQAWILYPGIGQH
jgi:hypothetical protein